MSFRQGRKYLQELIAETIGAWLSIVRAMKSRDSGDAIGLCGMVILNGSEQEIRYLVRRDYGGRGRAGESARGLLKIGFAEVNLHRIFATCLPENPASARVLEKIGMGKEGYQVKHLRIHGTWRDCRCYAVLYTALNTGRNRWRSVRTPPRSPSGCRIRENLQAA